MSRAGYILAVALAAAGCNEGNELIATGAFDFSQPAGDGAVMTPADLAAPAGDLATRSCGQIVSCVIQCGLTNLTCDPMCIQGADPMAIQEAGALTLCAVQNCISFGGDGGIGIGGGGTAGIFQCLIDNCQMQIAGCSGLFPAPM